ncbi:MAG: AAA family ATPase [Planctomycetaceae bacterium]|nr:AAA family ATPase [Planctomycetaceae bacterium]
MSFGPDAVEALRAALRVSPDNIPLRKHLAATLLGLGRADEAEAEYKQALAQSANDVSLKLGLADVFMHQGKNGAALVIVEDLLKQASVPIAAYLLHARLLVRAGEIQRAVHQYRQAISDDPDAADPELAAMLGIDADPETSEVVDGRVRESYVGGEARASSVERPSIAFAEVGGMDQVKEEIRVKIILPLKHPEMFKAYGKPVGGGILMYGPPGCGKTHLARATAGEVNANFISIGISEVLDMWIGSSERNLHELFEQGRRNRPCVLFFDEVDALGASRTDMRQAGGRHLINQFLSELDGVQSSNEGLLILAATNAPWHLDSAFRRPGRFDRILFVPPPDQKARADVLRVLLKGKPTDAVDHELVAKKADGFSGADMKAVVDLAIERKLREALTTGIPKPLTTKDLTATVAEVRPSTKEWFAAAKNYALYSNQGGLYDDILKYLKLAK